MNEVCTPPKIEIDDNFEEHATFGPKHTLADVARWVLRNPVDGGGLVIEIIGMMEHGEALELMALIMGVLKIDLVAAPSIEALDAISQSIGASLDKRRLGKNVIEGEGRVAFEEAARWAEVNRAILGVSRG